MGATSRGRLVSLAMIGFSGALFAIKYSPRLGVHPALAAPAYLAFFAAAAWAGGKAQRFLCRPWIMAALWACVAVPVFLRIDPPSLRVDRWSALHNFLQALFSGSFPYQALSHLDHLISGFPGLFLLAAPFYLLGDVGWLQFAALAAFIALAIRRLGDRSQAGYALLLLLLHPAFEYEVFCRSDLFSNMVAVAWLAFWLRDPGRRRGFPRALGEGAAWGLVLSTRGVAVIPFLVQAGAAWRARGWKQAAAGGAMAALCAALTLLPFYLWNRELFLAHNPLAVQGGYIPRWVLLLVAAAAVAAGFFDPRGLRLFRTLGALLFATLLVCLIIAWISKGWTEALWNGGFDITYFSLSLPFLLLGLREPAAEEKIPAANLVH